MRTFFVLAAIAAAAGAGLARAASAPAAPQTSASNGMQPPSGTSATTQAPITPGGIYAPGGIAYGTGAPDAGDTSTLSGAGPSVSTGPVVGSGPDVAAGPQVGPPDVSESDAGIH